MDDYKEGFWALQGSCTYESTVVATACTEPAYTQARPISAWREEMGIHPPPQIASIYRQILAPGRETVFCTNVSPWQADHSSVE